MTESRPPYRTAGGTGKTDVHPDNDTTALPRVGTDSAWSAPSVTSHGPSGSAGSSGRGPDRADDTGSGLSGFGAKLSAAGASAVAAATSAAASAKEALTNSGQAPGPDSSLDAMSSPAPRGNAASRSSAAAPPRTRGRAGRQPRKARLTLSHVNVYSVFKFSCVLAIALFFVWLIMVGVLYGLLDVAGVLTQVNTAVAKITGGSNPKDVVTGSLVFGAAIIIGAVYIVLFIALSTIGAMIYNLCADLVGGAELTLSERE